MFGFTHLVSWVGISEFIDVICKTCYAPTGSRAPHTNPQMPKGAGKLPMQSRWKSVDGQLTRPHICTVTNQSHNRQGKNHGQCLHGAGRGGQGLAWNCFGCKLVRWPNDPHEKFHCAPTVQDTYIQTIRNQFKKRSIMGITWATSNMKENRCGRAYSAAL